jgi:hypothetical protein
MRSVVDGPGVARRAGARGQAGHQGIEALAPKTIALQRGRFGDVAQPNRSPRQKPCDVVGRQLAADARTRAHQAHDFMPAVHKRAHGRAADRAGGTEDEDALRG